MSDSSPSSPRSLTIQILDVGQGDAIYVEFPNGRNMLVDFGSTKGRRVAPPDALKFLQTFTRFKDEGATLDYLVITHADSDHYNQLGKFFDTLKPKVNFLLYGGDWDDYAKGVRDRLEKEVRTILAPPKARPFGFEEIEEVDEPSQFKLFGGVEVLVLAIDAPPVTKNDEGWRKNTASAVLQLKYAGRSVILAGDATIDTEEAILKTFANVGNLRLELLRSEVLKVAHHGSARTSTRPAWVQVVQPSFVFISSDRHGALDESEQTGHRLPQELGIDLIRSLTRLAPAVEHPYVSSYDPADYAGYHNPDTGKAMPIVPNIGAKPALLREQGKDPPAQWYGPRTTEGIFTTLAQMDRRSPIDASEADQGVQYEIEITATGAIHVRATADLETVTPIVTPG